MNPLGSVMWEGLFMRIVWFHYGWGPGRVAELNLRFYYGTESRYYVHPASTLSWPGSPSVEGMFRAYLISSLTLHSKPNFGSKGGSYEKY